MSKRKKKDQPSPVDVGDVVPSPPPADETTQKVDVTFEPSKEVVPGFSPEALAEAGKSSEEFSQVSVNVWTPDGAVPKEEFDALAEYDPTKVQSIETTPEPETETKTESTVTTWTPDGPVEDKNPMANADWIEDWALSHQRCATWHVIAAGPSIHEHCLKVDWRGRPAICCNGVPLIARGIDNWISVDEPRDALASWANSDVTTNKFINHAVEADFKRIVFKHWNRVGPNRDPFKYGLFWHGSVAMAAVDLARVLGARQVILWGLDYVDRSHAYDELFPDMVSKGLPQWDLEKINNRWKDMAHELKYQGGPEILNANPNSRLKVLPFIDPKKALEMM